jgi:hypothetical protein
MMLYVGGDEPGKDHISWWLPKRLCLEQILKKRELALKKIGFKSVTWVGNPKVPTSTGAVHSP